MKITRFICKTNLLLALALSCSITFAEGRVWTLLDGRSIDASFVVTIGANYVFKSPTGKQIKIPATAFSEEDRVFIELLKPPELKIDVIKNLKTVIFTAGWYGDYPRDPEQHGNFGFRIKQTSSGAYRHELRAEYFIIAKQLHRTNPKCFLLDRGEFAFSLTEESKRTFEFMSDRRVRLQNWELPETNIHLAYGETYYASVIVIKDQRGAIVRIEASKSWMEKNLDNLRKLNVGNFFDKKCVRCFPGRPNPLHW